MLGTLIKALEVDFRTVENERYLRSATNLRQNLERILAIRKHYPEFTDKKPLMFPKLNELSQLSKKEGLCLTYWHDCSELSEFRAVIANKTDAIESALLTSKPSRFKTASLSRFMQRSEDAVLFSYLSDVSKAKGSHKSKRVLNTESHRYQVTGLLYQLHLLEGQLQTMLSRHGHTFNFAPQTNFAPNGLNLETFKTEILETEKKFVERSSSVPISFDSKLQVERRETAAASLEPSPTEKSQFTPTGPLDIWYSLAEDPKTPRHFLFWLAESENQYVSQRALATLKRQTEPQSTALFQPQPQQLSPTRLQPQPQIRSQPQLQSQPQHRTQQQPHPKTPPLAFSAQGSMVG